MPKDFPTLTDSSYMPFGKYAQKNSKMRAVPARYLLWLWNDGLYCETTAEGDRGDVARYVKANMKALTLEHDDTIPRAEEIPDDADEEGEDENTLDFTRRRGRFEHRGGDDEDEEDRWG